MTFRLEASPLTMIAETGANMCNVFSVLQPPTVSENQVTVSDAFSGDDVKMRDGTFYMRVNTSG
jgi:CHASE2 domain-containing sensor protein